MAASLRGWHVRLPKPRTFLGIMSLQTGTEMIALSMLINKVTGIYGLLVIFTGYALSATQLTMYMCNVVALVLLALCLPHVKKQTPLHNLGLAWLYLLDTAINTAYTTAFAVTWFMASGAAANAEPPSSALRQEDGGGGDAISGSNGNPAADGHSPADGEWMGAHEAAASLVFIALFTTIRLYFAAVVMAHARRVLMRWAETQGVAGGGRSGAEESKGDLTGSPFAPDLPGGQGWRGKLGRAMVYVGRDFWLGASSSGADDTWARDVNAKFRRAPVSGGGGSSSSAV
ncbi:uncharacterized protein E0L32_010642 [Thyridium curvatum]|uniref:Inositolphosphorylceramide synthase subunit Kei1-domain-containing protein n=1 Tax=Thyridium curvatum TaxID=1093900 RepID=A0A507AN02_9PEZI|nr:uncharacterized protein E0L32_010642 [Thyridium curvatum]TPX07644.1 hypothetical protein E0L32_010642 [Thyridium curvatum]